MTNCNSFYSNKGVFVLEKSMFVSSKKHAEMSDKNDASGGVEN